MNISGPGNVTSPNFPAEYPNIASCLWEFVAEVGYRVQLQFHAFDLEWCPRCSCDNVQVHDDVYVHMHVHTCTYTTHAYTCIHKM